MELNFVTGLTLVVLLLGSFYTFLPHSIHVQFAPDWLFGLNFPHSYHVSIGLFLLLIGLLVANNKYKFI